MTKEVLINKIDKGVIEWYADNMKQIIIQSEIKNKKQKAQKNKKEFESWNLELGANYKIGEFTKVRITKAVPFKLYGEII